MGQCGSVQLMKGQKGLGNGLLVKLGTTRIGVVANQTMQGMMITPLLDGVEVEVGMIFPTRGAYRGT